MKSKISLCTNFYLANRLFNPILVSACFWLPLAGAIRSAGNPLDVWRTVHKCHSLAVSCSDEMFILQAM